MHDRGAPPVATGADLSAGVNNSVRRLMWRAFNEGMEQRRRARRLRLLEADLLGGLPPHLASMHSTAPWWRAQRAARWLERQDQDYDTFENALRKRIFGDGG
jgi:hypothetical protein